MKNVLYLLLFTFTLMHVNAQNSTSQDEKMKCPNVITNDCLKCPDFPGDYRTPEQKIPDLSELDRREEPA